MPLSWAIFEVCINGLQIGLTLYLGLMLFEPRRKAPRTSCYVVPLWIAGTALLSIFSFVDVPVIPDIVPGILVFMIMTGCFRQGPLLYKALSCTIYFIVCGVLALVVRIVVMRVLQVSWAYIEGNNAVRLVYVASINILLVAAAFLLIRIGRKILPRSITQQHNYGVSAVFFILPVTSLGLLLGMLSTMSNLPAEIIPGLNFEIAAIAILVLNGLLLWVFNQMNVQNENAMIVCMENHRMALQLHYYDETERFYDDMMHWEHDHKKHLQTMLSYVENNQSDVLRGYLQKLLGHYETILPTVSTGNCNMDAILNVFVAMYQREGVIISVNMKMPEQLPIEDNDLTVIMGNLLDNAWDACLTVADQDKRFIQVSGKVNGGILEMQIANSASATHKRLGIRGLTSKQDIAVHGQGQYIVEKLVDKYDGYITYMDEGDLYTANLIFSLPV